MSDPAREVNVGAWVERARADPVAYAQRQAAEIVLNAIALSVPLRSKLYLKGGVLMGLAYDSPRQTSDVDLTADLPVSPDIDKKIGTLLDAAFPRAAAKLGYADMIVRVHTIKRSPKAIFETADFPALKLKIGYARRGSEQEKALIEKTSPPVIDLDISFNERESRVQLLELTGGEYLHAYSLATLIAEKYRAVLQQAVRNRNRRQDIYDLALLIENPALDENAKAEILYIFLVKARSRRLDPHQGSLDDAEIKARSHAEWQSLALEIGNLPDFDESYKSVKSFYESLPWAASGAGRALAPPAI